MTNFDPSWQTWLMLTEALTSTLLGWLGISSWFRGRSLAEKAAMHVTFERLQNDLTAHVLADSEALTRLNTQFINIENKIDRILDREDR